MSIIRKFLEEKFVNKRRSTKYDYETILVDVEGPYKEHINKLKNIFKSDDLYSKSDKMLHITILYGLKNISKNDVKDIFLDTHFKEFDVKITGIHMFRNESDVLVLKCESPELHELRQHVEQLPYKKTHADYKPHITLAYVKSGRGQHYKNILEKLFKPGTIKIKYIYYSNKAGEKILRFKLNN